MKMYIIISKCKNDCNITEGFANKKVSDVVEADTKQKAIEKWKADLPYNKGKIYQGSYELIGGYQVGKTNSPKRSPDHVPAASVDKVSMLRKGRNK